jgi:hypothetical protein
MQQSSAPTTTFKPVVSTNMKPLDKYGSIHPYHTELYSRKINTETTVTKELQKR